MQPKVGSDRDTASGNAPVREGGFFTAGYVQVDLYAAISKALDPLLVEAERAKNDRDALEKYNDDLREANKKFIAERIKNANRISYLENREATQAATIKELQQEISRQQLVRANMTHRIAALEAAAIPVTREEAAIKHLTTDSAARVIMKIAATLREVGL